MLDIFILENDRAAFEILKALCLRYLVSKNFQGEIYEYSHADCCETSALYMLSLGEETPELSRKIRSLNSENYIVALLDNYGDLKKAVTPAICPSGFLVKPFGKADTEAVLDEVYTDRIRCRTNDKGLGSFCFKTKAREFTLPFEKIIFFESRNKKIIVRTEAQEFEFYDTLDSVVKKAPECFMKIHKSFVVNLKKIIAADYGAMTVEFEDGSIAYMSRTYKNELRELLSEGREQICSQHT